MVDPNARAKKRNLAFLLILLLVFIPPYSISSASYRDPSFELTFKKYGDKYIFYLNGKPWYPKIVIYDPNSRFWRNLTVRQEIERFKNDGFNSIAIVVLSNWVKDPVFREEILDPVFQECVRQNLPVIVYLMITLWELVPEWMGNKSMWLHMKMLYTGVYSNSPDVKDPVFLEDYMKRVESVIAYTRQYHNIIIAYHMEDSDFWNIPEGGFYWTMVSNGSRIPPLSNDIDETQMPYNPGILQHFRSWLEENDIAPESLGFESIEEVYIPYNPAHARSIEHWLVWKEYRRRGYMLSAIRSIAEFIRNQTKKPVSIGVDIGYRYNDFDQLAIPIPELDEAVDIVAVYLGWEPSWLSSWRGWATRDMVDAPVIGFFDVYWKNELAGEYAYPSLYILASAPFVAGHMIALPRARDEAPNMTMYKELVDAMNYVEETNLWLYSAIKPKVGIFSSIPDAMYTGSNNHPYDYPYYAAQNAYHAMLLRSGIPTALIHEADEIFEYDVVIAGLSAPYVQFTKRYSALTAEQIRSYVSGGGVFVKGPFPLRAEPPMFLDIGGANDADKSGDVYIEGDWSEPEFFENCTVRWLGSNSLIKFRVEELSSYEISVMFKDIYPEDLRRRLWLEVKTGQNVWEKVESHYYPGCYRLNVWRLITFVVPVEYIHPENEYQTIRLVADSPFPVAFILIAPLSEFSPSPEMTIYNFGLLDTNLIVDLPGLSKGEDISSVKINTWMLSEYIRVDEGDIVLAKGKVEGLHEEGAIAVARRVGEGFILKLGFSPAAEWFEDIAKCWTFKGFFNKLLEKFLVGLILRVKPQVKAYSVRDPNGLDITDKVLCIISRLPNTENYKLVILNIADRSIEYALYLNSTYLKDYLRGDLVFKGKLPPRHGEVLGFNLLDYVIIDKVFVSDDRADAGSVQEVAFHIIWSRNSSDVRNGILYINGTAYPINATGWAVFDVSYDDVGMLTWMVTGVKVGNLSIYTVKSNYPRIVFDRVKVVEGGVSKELPRVGETVTLWVKLVYEYDGREFNGSTGMVYLNGSPMSWSLANRRWEYNYTADRPGVMRFVVSKVLDRLYGLTAVNNTVGSLSITWVEPPIIETPLGIMSLAVFSALILAVLLLIRRRRRLMMELPLTCSSSSAESEASKR